ncbi:MULTISPECIES: hypothetical protein [unclassified Sedimentibacter]|uniref:hypothetical protein n=1 Tax=unclassified Sedimentibacter TaxID=2649220 RepID=UPI0027DEBB41|nr:hypothetical protein [Sedimentibacter sp. MB35-C1]WMJ76333.1 hypothetical protein RBQ61_11935 [Sedimentibacter sp. MB35-C1]
MRNYNNKNYMFYKYKKPIFSYSYPCVEYNIQNVNEVFVNTEIGFLELSIFTNNWNTPVKNAQITFYVKNGEAAVPIKSIIYESEPILVELPVAHISGELIQGPEYFFTPYDMMIEKEDYNSINVLNIRIFPGIRTQFNYNLNPVKPEEPYKQETIAIPPHPRDLILDR